jgi:hypothetical protein
MIDDALRYSNMLGHAWTCVDVVRMNAGGVLSSRYCKQWDAHTKSIHSEMLRINGTKRQKPWLVRHLLAWSRRHSGTDHPPVAQITSSITSSIAEWLKSSIALSPLGRGLEEGPVWGNTTPQTVAERTGDAMCHTSLGSGRGGMLPVGNHQVLRCMNKYGKYGKYGVIHETLLDEDTTTPYSAVLRTQYFQRSDIHEQATFRSIEATKSNRTPWKTWQSRGLGRLDRQRRRHWGARIDVMHVVWSSFESWWKGQRIAEWYDHWDAGCYRGLRLKDSINSYLDGVSRTRTRTGTVTYLRNGWGFPKMI